MCENARHSTQANLTGRELTKLCNLNSVYLGMGVLTNSSYILHGHILKELYSPNELMIIIEMPRYITAFPPAFSWLERGRCR